MADYLHFVLGLLSALAIGIPFGIWYMVMERQRFLVEMWTKPMPVLALAFFLLIAYVTSVAQSTVYTLLVMVELFVSAIADSVFVCAECAVDRKVVPVSKATSAVAVVLFFLVQVLWAILFSFSPAFSSGLDPTTELAPVRIWILLLLAVLISFTLGTLLWFGKGPRNMVELMFVSLYIMASAVSIWRAGARVGFDSTYQRLDSQILALLGILVFAVSDSLIYVHHYVKPFAASRALIMSFYWVAQGLLTLGAFLYV
jgi:NADH:ubiquinone oxidoreductase subunit K